jgi:DNA-binding phage protein
MEMSNKAFKMTETQHALVLDIFEELKEELHEYNILSVAEASGVTDACIHLWLSGQTKKPRLDTVVRVADAIGFDMRLVRRKQVRPVLSIVRSA